MKFDIRLLWRAERDIDHIVTWLHERSPQGAAAWHQVWKDTFNTLQASADVYGLAAEDADQELEIRQITFRTRKGRDYRALYTIRGKEVFVMHIRGPGQDIVPPEELQVL
ncbi:MAG: type II toxin-antitoxin system RelE/ParE family toxin [Planctomycetes bacterium]|nr:type II toxin-antitoxin system RelE/ParE family toxin [Planctomycetota bacterium]